MINSLSGTGQTWFQYSNAARANGTVADSVPGTPGTGIDALMNNFLSSYVNSNPGVVTHVLMNWGVNDMGGSLVEATWIGQYDQITSYLHTRFPNATLVISYPWRQGFDSQSATMHGWIDTVIANCAGVGATCIAGVDEVVTIKGSDNGATATRDGVHYSAAGFSLYAAAMKAALGY